MAVRHGHSSSRFDKPPKSLAQQVGRATSSGKEANLLTFTEVGNKARADALKADGWGRFVPHGETDCAVMWAKEEFSVAAKFTSRLGDGTWHMDGGADMALIAATVVLDHKSGHRLWVSVAHFPSSVQEGDRFSNDQTDADRVRCWKEGTNAWESRRKSAGDKYHHDMAMHVADWNVDCRMGVWRTEIDDRLGPDRFRGTWTAKNAPKDGTHGDRLIDATWSNGQFKDTFLLPDDDSSDHRPFGEVIAWPAD